MDGTTSSDEITPEMTIEEMAERYPQAARFFLRFGIRCFTCSGILWGTIAEALRSKGAEDVEATVAELRRFLSENTQS